MTRVLALALTLTLLAGAVPAGAQDKSLYERLGRYDAIAAVVDDFTGRLVADPEFARFFAGSSTDSKRRLRQNIVDQICMLAGEPCYYLGRPTKTAHAGMGITEREWQATVAHLTATLDRFKVPAREKQDLLNALTTLKGDVVEK
jgi:hemoglobin